MDKDTVYNLCKSAVLHMAYAKSAIPAKKLLCFPLVLLKRKSPFILRKWRILLISSSCGVNQKRNSGGITFEKSSTVTPQVEYSFLPPKTDGSPHFLLLWRILLKFPLFEESSPKEELCQNSFWGKLIMWRLWDRTNGVMTASFRKSSDKTTCIFIHELYKNDEKNEGPLKSMLICQILVSLNQFFKVQACYTICSESFYMMRSAWPKTIVKFYKSLDALYGYNNLEELSLI